MGSNAARSVPIISWHQPAQRHLVPDLGAAAALPHEKKVGLDLISHSILLLTVCMAPQLKKRTCMCVGVGGEGGGGSVFFSERIRAHQTGKKV